MSERGGRIGNIIKAGQWAAPAFMAYLDLETAENTSVLDAVLNESEDGDEVALTQKTSQNTPAKMAQHNGTRGTRPTKPGFRTN